MQRVKLNESEAETLRRFRAGESIDQIARARGFVRNTICGHLALAVESGARSGATYSSRPRKKKKSPLPSRTAGAQSYRSPRAARREVHVGELRIFRALAAREL